MYHYQPSPLLWWLFHHHIHEDAHDNDNANDYDYSGPHTGHNSDGLLSLSQVSNWNYQSFDNNLWIHIYIEMTELFCIGEIMRDLEVNDKI